MEPIFNFFFLNKVVVDPKNSAWIVSLTPAQCNHVHEQCRLQFIRAKKKKKKRKTLKRTNANANPNRT